MAERFGVIEGVGRCEVPSRGCPVTLRAGCGAKRGAALLTIGNNGLIELQCAAPPEAGERVVVTLPDRLRVVGTCRDRLGDRVWISLHASLSNLHRDAGNVRPLRTDGPRSLSGALVTVTTEDGRTARCGVRDVSLTGLFVWCDLDLQVGDKVMVGQASAEVVRTGEGGYGLAMGVGQLGEDALDAEMVAAQAAGV